MEQQTTPNRGGNLFNNAADPLPGPFFQNPGPNQNNNGGVLPPQNTNLPQNQDANGPMPLPSPEDMYRMMMAMNQNLALLLTENQNTRARLEELFRGRQIEPEREAPHAPPPPLSINSEIPAPPEQPFPPRAQPDPVVNWLHQNPMEPPPQQAPPQYEPF